MEVRRGGGTRNTKSFQEISGGVGISCWLNSHENWVRRRRSTVLNADNNRMTILLTGVGDEKDY